MGKLLSGGLILRSLAENPQDKERFAEFMHNAFENDGDWRESGFTAWINELLYTHPSMNLEHVWCVVDPANNGKIVSGLFLIPQIWRYEDIEIPVGRPEIVGTLPDYRRRGLVRELFDVLHKYSEQQGDLIQAITGIPYFYRKFGYGVATDLGLRGQIPFTAIPKVNDDETPTYTLRPAEISDIPSFLEFEQSASRHALLTTARDATLWHYELTGRNPKSPWYMHYHTICNQNHDPVGFVGFNNAESAKHSMIVWQWLIGDDANYLETFEDILRAMRDIAKSNDEKIVTVDFYSTLHPALVQLLKRQYGASMRDRMYAWYLRIPDHVKFIQRIAPVLECRLVGSAARGYTGKLRINFYQRDDLLIVFNKGKITEVKLTREEGYPNARFPHDTWINLVFGANTEAEIQNVLPDTMSTAESAVLLSILFPKKKSSLFAVN